MMDLLFTVSAFELFVGGGGRLLEVGPVTVRMLLFALCIVTGLYFGLTKHRRVGGVGLALALVGAYLVIHLTAVLAGAIAGEDPKDIFGDLQPSLYWLAAPFVAIVLRRRRMVERTGWLVCAGGVSLALAYVAVLVLIVLGAIDGVALFIKLNDTGEFFLRSETFFFYKGFLYLGLAAVFFVALRPRYATPLLLLVVSALVLTLTRGFVLSTAIAVILLLVAQRRWGALGLATVALLIAVAMVWIYLPSTSDSLSDRHDVSNSQRLADMQFMLDNLRVRTIFFGEGFGGLIDNRVNIENTFLWVWWKLGIFGLAFWLLPLVLCGTYFSRTPRKDPSYSLACAFFFGTVLVYVQTATNPYLNNPIGLSFVLMALFSLRTLSGEPVRARPPDSTRSALLPVELSGGPP